MRIVQLLVCMFSDYDYTVICWFFSFIQARQRVQDMLQKSRELTQKAVVVSDSEDEEEEVDSEEEMMERELSALSSNPWMKVQAPAAPKSDFTRAEVMLNSEGHEETEESESDEDADVLEKMGKELKKKQTEEATQTAQIVEEDIDEIFQKLEDKDQVKDEEAKIEKGNSKRKRRKKRKKKVEEVKAEVEKEEVGDVPLISEGLKRKKTLEDIEEDEDESEEEGPSSFKSAGPKNGRDFKNVNGGDSAADSKTEEVFVDPNKLFTLETKIYDIANPDITVGDNEEESDGEEAQRSMIAQAFADDDVIDEFVREKNATVDRDKPKDINLFLPGWGSWGGESIKVSNKKRKK